MARWNLEVKRWFSDLPREQYVRFFRWILRDTDEATISTESLYLVEELSLSTDPENEYVSYKELYRG